MPRRSETTTSRSVTLLAIVAVVAVLYFARAVLIPLALSVLLSFILAPLVNRLERLRLPRVVSVLLVVGLAFVVIGVLGRVVFVQVNDVAEQIPRYSDNIKEKIKTVTPGRNIIDKVTDAAEKVGATIEEAAAEVAEEEGATPEEAPTTREALSGDEPVPVRLARAESSLIQRVTSAGPIVGVIAGAAIVIVFVIFILMERDSLRDRIIHLAGRGRLNITTVALDEAGERVSRYLLTQLLINFLYGLPVAIGLWFIGVPNALLWGLMAMVLRFIPYAGPWIGALLPIVLSLAVFDGWQRPAMVISLFVVLELISNNILEPWLYGSNTGVSALAVLVSALFWTWLWGPVGLVLAVPMTVCVVVAGRYVPQLRFLTVLLSSEPVLEADERFYQRLLAMDDTEAYDVAEEYAKEHSLAACYDEVMLPGLSLAERDRHAGSLDERRFEFIRNAMRALIEEMGEEHDPETRLDEPVSSNGVHVPRVVVCIPARDEADEVAGLMLRQLLEARRVTTEVFSQSMLTSEMLDAIERLDPNWVCVSAVPPYAITHSRYLCKRLTARFPERRLVVGTWTLGRTEGLRQRLGLREQDRVVTTLRDAVQVLMV